MKYNKSEIMKAAHKAYSERAISWQAHESVRYNGVNYGHNAAPFGYFLHMAWQGAKFEARKAERAAAERAARLASRKPFAGAASFEGYYFKLWEKNGMRRIYINGTGYQSRVNGAYIDANTCEIHCKRDETRKLAERFMEAYNIAA